MGMDPLTIGLGLSAASSLYGAFSQNKTNSQNLAAQQGRQTQIDQFIQPYLQSGANPYSSQLMKMLDGGPGGFKAPTAYDPAMVSPTAIGTQGFNTGQDSYSQLLRAGGSPFDTSSMFSALAPLDNRALTQQVAALRSSTGSLGARFGSANLTREANLRRDFLQNVGARNAGIQQQSYESAQNRMMQAAGGLQQGGLGQMGLLAQILQGNQNAQNQGSMFNAGQNQAWNSFMANVLGQAGGLQNQQQGLNNQLLGIMAGQPVPAYQPSALPGAGGEIGQLLMFLPFLRQSMGQQRAAGVALPNNVGPYYVPGAP